MDERMIPFLSFCSLPCPFTDLCPFLCSRSLMGLKSSPSDHLVHAKRVNLEVTFRVFQRNQSGLDDVFT